MVFSLKRRAFPIIITFQLEELEQIPEKTERDVAELKGKLEKLEKDKEREDKKLEEVMDSLKTETQVKFIEL